MNFLLFHKPKLLRDYCIDMSTSIQEALRNIRNTHTYIEIHSELLKMMKTEYDMLRRFFESSQEDKSILIEISKTDTIDQPDIHLPFPDVKTEVKTEVKTLEINTDKKQTQKQGSSSQEMKKWQKGEEQKKLAELTVKGINPESLLTIENLKVWIEGDGKTYAFIAREYLGIPEHRVADFGKKHGIQSKISKKRAIIASGAVVKKLRG